MFGLLMFLLFVTAALYGVFFLLFKGIWLLFKKHKNLWPLILAGISTLASIGALIGLTIWGISLILQPFLPMKQRWETNPQPIYGLRTYTDPTYHFTLQLPDGMDYSEWIDLEGYSVKLGFNTNLVKKDSSGKGISGPLLFSIIIRQNQRINTADPFGMLEKELLKQSADRQFTLQEHKTLEINGHPAYYAAGTANTDRGNVPLWLQAIYQDGVIIYVVSSEITKENAPATNDAQTLATSLQPVLTNILPALAAE